MSGSRPTVGIRLSAEGAEKVRRDIEALGPAGQRAFDMITRASSLAQPEMQKLGTSIDVVQRTFIGMGGSMGRVGSVVTGVAGVAGTATTAFLALGAAAVTAGIGIAKAGDEAVATMARLTSATGGLAQAQAVYERLFQLSQQTGIAVSESAGSFARFSVAAKEIGATNDQVLRLTGGIQKAGIVAGATGQEVGAAVAQIGQALASGKLQGDELRSLLENMPQLGQALARELGVSVGQLRQMGTEGKLTAETVFPALLRASEKMGAEFDKMPVTMSRAKDILLAATEDFGQRLDRITGLSQTFAKFMQQGASALRSAGVAIAPTDREAADQGVAAAERRAAQVRAQVAAERAASAYGDVSPGLKQAEEIAAQELQDALARQNEIRRSDRELQRAEAVDAAQQAADSRRTRLGIEVRDAAEFADKRLKIARETAEKLKLINDAEAAGVKTMGGAPGIPGATFDAARARAGVLREQREELEKLAKEEAKGGEEAKKAAEKRQDVIDKLDEQVKAAERATAATMSGAASSREMAIALEVEGKLREAGIPAIEKRSEAEKKAAAIIEDRVRGLDKAKEAEKAYETQVKKTKEYTDKSWNELAGIGERAMDRLGDAIVNAFTSGNGAAINFGNIAKSILGSVAADVAKLAIVNPILNSLFTSSSGPRATLSGAFGGSATAIGGGGGFNLGSLSGLSSLLPSSWTSGFSGIGSSIFGTAGVSPATASLFGDVTGIGASAIPGTPGLLGTYGTSLMGGSALTLGGAMSGIGMGMGAGGLVNSLLGGNQTNGMIGSALGSIGGFLIGGPLGGLIGGAAGGGLGGLIGPGKTVNSYGLRLQSSGFVENGANDFAGSLVPVSRQYYDEAGKALFDQADQVVAAVNAYMSANGLQVAGASIIGGNKNGPDGSGFGTVGEAFANLHFGAANDNKLNTYLSTQTFDDPAKLQAAVDGYKQIQAVIEAAAAEAIPAFTASINAVVAATEPGIFKAREYGLAEDALWAAREKAIAQIHEQRTETLRQSDVALSIRRLAAGGNTQEAELARQAEAARLELESFGKSLDALAISAEDKAARLVNIEEVQAAERAAIIERYGEQAANALRQAGANIRGYLDSLATGTAAGASPTDRLSAAQANFERDRLLATGGDRDALGRITGSADALLSAGRDMYASGQGFQDIRGTVTGGLSNLPVVQSYDAMQAASLAAIQATLAGTLSTQTIILSNGNTVQIAGGVGDMSAVTAGLTAQHATLIQATGVLGQIFNQQFEQLKVGVAQHATEINSEGALYALGLIGNATNDNLGLSNRIATDASAASVAGLAALTTVSVDASAAQVAALNASNTISASNATLLFAAIGAGNTIASDGNSRLSSINSYSSFIDNTLQAQNNYILDLRTELQGLRQQIAALNTSIQQGATLNATETRAAGALVAGRVEEATDQIRKQAA